ncbi:MAG: hypothetical protein ABEJ26_12150 [Halosimplex sp.]
MPCPHRGNSDSDRLSRRDFVRTAVAIGGASALSACLDRDGGGSGSERSGTDTGAMPDLPKGDPESVPERQHSWADYVLSDEHGNPKFPEYQAFQFLDYAAEGTPSETDRDTVESAFRSLEEAFVWGAGSDAQRSFFHEGIFFTISYSPSYFDRFETDLPDSVDLRPVESVLDAIGEDRSVADHYDAVLHLATDYPEVLLATELALFGERDELNGVEMEAHLGDVFERRERRAGFVGTGLPAEKLDDERISEDAPQSMGFKSGLLDNLPSEDRVTIPEGPFAESTTMQVSQLLIDVDSWYDRDFDERVERMYSPYHDSEDVGKAGKEVASSSGITKQMADRTEQSATERGVVGHSQKLARARDDEFNPRLLRRGDFNGVRPDGAVLNFGSLHRTIGDLVETLEAMYKLDFGDDEATLDEGDNGILADLETASRSTYLMPPRRLRALPPARPE